MGGGYGVAYIKETALLETLGNETNFDPFQTCREYSQDYQCIVKFVVTVVLVEDVDNLSFCIEWKCCFIEVDLRPSFNHLHQFQVFFNGCFQVLEFKKNWPPSYLKVMLIKMGPSKDIWIYGFWNFGSCTK